MDKFTKIKKKNGDTLTTIYPITNLAKSKICDEHGHTVFRYSVTIYITQTNDTSLIEITKYEYNRLMKLHAKGE